MKRQSKALYVIICGVLSIVITLLFSTKIMSLFHMYEDSDEATKIDITVLDESNAKSYGKEMRIVSFTVDGEKLNLADYETDSFVWHEEWGYILYQNGDNHLEIELDHAANSISMEYVKQEGSGNALVSINGEQFCSLHMYRGSWKNVFLDINFINQEQDRIAKIEIALLIFILLLFLGMGFLEFKNPSGNKKIKSNFAMFDLAKGIGILTIILWHSNELVLQESSTALMKNDILLGVLYLFIVNALMPMFFLVSGYGFRLGKLKETAKKQFHYLVKPYCFVTFGVCLVSIIRFFADDNYGVIQLRKSILPFVLGNAHDGFIGNVEINMIGPMWYVVSLCFAWIILTFIMNLKQKQSQYIAMGLSLLLGFGLSWIDFNYWTLMQAFSAVLFLYIGYWIKKNKILVHENRYTMLIYAGMMILLIPIMIVNGYSVSMALNHWGGNYFLAIFAGVMAGILALRGILQLDQIAGNRLKSIRLLGRNSYLIFYIHSFEYLAIPWDKLFVYLPANSLARIAIISILRGIVIAMIYYMVVLVKKKRKAKA